MLYSVGLIGSRKFYFVFLENILGPIRVPLCLSFPRDSNPVATNRTVQEAPFFLEWIDPSIVPALVPYRLWLRIQHEASSDLIQARIYHVALVSFQRLGLHSRTTN